MSDAAPKENWLHRWGPTGTPEQEQEPEPLPASEAVPWAKIAGFSFLTLIFTAVLSLIVLGTVFGLFMLVFAGIPFGLFALIWHERLRRRERREGEGTFGFGSVFGRGSQIASLAINLGLLAIGIWLVLKPRFISVNGGIGRGAESAVLFLTPGAGSVLCAMAFYTLLSRQHVAQERYAIVHRLPARHLIRVSRVLSWLAWALVVSLALIFWFSSNDWIPRSVFEYVWP